MSRINEKALMRESHIKQILDKVHEMCKQAEEDLCVQPALEEELEELLYYYVK